MACTSGTLMGENSLSCDGLLPAKRLILACSDAKPSAVTF